MMNILGLYIEETLSLLRRVRAPFSVLAARNHRFHLLQIDSFVQGITFGADVTVLANWKLRAHELDALAHATKRRSIVVDCSDPRLLDDELYRAQLELANLVTVPNDWMKRAIKSINPNVWVTPSCVDLPHFIAANKIKLDPKRPIIIGCLGLYDWYLVKDAIFQLLEKHEHLMVVTESSHARAFTPHDRVLAVDLSVYNLPEVIRNCHFGLIPIDGERGYDDIWRYEYGALCRPVISPPVAKGTAYWVKSCEELLASPRVRALLGKQAFLEANEHRATQLADKYLSIYRKRLPHLAFS